MLHREESRLSQAPSLGSSAVYTTTSSSTQWGPGALAGKAMLALGKAAIRGAERLVISRRISTIRAYVPYSDDNVYSAANEAFLRGLLDDLTELSRPGFYPQQVRLAAMELILGQISSFQTRHIVAVLSEWLVDDLILLISEVMAVSLFCRAGLLDDRLSVAYLASTSKERQSHGPTVAFIGALIKSSQAAFEAALLAGFLDFLLFASVPRGLQTSEEDKEIFESAYSTVSCPPPHLSSIWTECTAGIWTRARKPSLSDLHRKVSEHGCEKMREIHARFLYMVFPRILQKAIPPHSGLSENWGVRASSYNDGKPSEDQLRPRAVVEPDINQLRALKHFASSVSLGCNVLEPTLERLRGKTHRTKCIFFYYLSSLLLPAKHGKSAPAIHHSLDSQFPTPNRHVRLINFMLDVASCGREFREAILDGVLTLLVPKLVEESDPSAIYSNLYCRRNFCAHFKRRPSYSVCTLELLAMVKQGGLASVINPANSQASREIAEIFQPLLTVVHTRYGACSASTVKTQLKNPKPNLPLGVVQQQPNPIQ
ncbi:hypothetical protein C8F01DRAFT_1158742 [Mycena amicta]|nr:hypothetical protein C8F01DRAFT_1158742 [Mycena amicta]